MITKQISLYYKDGSSDKVYHAQIEQKDSGYILNFQYGKRNSTLTAGTKTKTPVELTVVEKEYLKLIKEKTSKGYTEGESGAVFQSQDLEERITGIVPQLLNNAKDEEMSKLFKDDTWFMQEKKDGRRLITKSYPGEFIAINKKGLSISIPQSVVDLVKKVPQKIVLDGEIIGEVYYIFDILELGDDDLRTKPAIERYRILSNIKELTGFVIPAYFEKAEKEKAFEEFKLKKKEGVVFKKNGSSYVSGRPASSGNQLKYKFWESATVIVIGHHKTKRSVLMAAYKNGEKMAIGKVTIPPNYSIPNIGELIEVIYLYCHIGGALFQTKYKGVRDDQDFSDCDYDKLKFKSLEDDEDDEDE
ncbi:WGR domain-containing protein [archaeon]|nr:WGR domain-containing protein [archaeon]